MLALGSIALIASDAAAKDSNKGRHLEQAPNWMMNTSEGKAVELYKELDQGNTVVMVFWATWCRFCEKLLPALDARMATQTGSYQNTRVYAMNIWENANPLHYARDRFAGIPVILDADSVARRFRVRATPGIIIVQPDRNTTYIKQSRQNVDAIIERIEASLTQIPIVGTEPTSP